MRTYEFIYFLWPFLGDDANLDIGVGQNLLNLLYFFFWAFFCIR